MNIVVIGAGTVGSSIAELLVRSGHNLTLIDTNRQRLLEISEMYDLQTIVGSGCSYEILQSAGVDRAQLVLAMTDNDEVNLLSAQIARFLGAGKTVARVRKREYLEPIKFNVRSMLGIDLIISPEVLTAVEIARFLANPDSLTLAHFAQDKVQLRQLSIAEDSPFAGKLVKDLRLPRGLLLVLISRDNEVIIPHGDSQLKPGDRVSFIGESSVFRKACSLFGVCDVGIKSICVAGGGEIGMYLAEILDRQDYVVKLIDLNPERCEFLSEHLNKTQVVYGDVTNRYFLEEERIHNSDVFIAVTGDDETNVMSSLLAKEIGVKQCITKVDRPDYAEVIERVGIDLALSPRLITAEKILTLLARGRIKSLSLLEEGKVEVIEYEVAPETPITGESLSRLQLPRQALVGMIVREGDVRVPQGQDRIYPGDTVIMIARAEVVEKVEQFFSPEKVSDL
ncbi:Trk system potassium transporter TrkA [Candidatus Sumerlaeota bacterium]|nr:Trk system potassium transporter TrkA [Candidatus Sumerlaeota bacterium]